MVGNEGKVDESIKLMAEVEELKKKRHELDVCRVTSTAGLTMCTGSVQGTAATWFGVTTATKAACL